MSEPIAICSACFTLLSYIGRCSHCGRETVIPADTSRGRKLVIERGLQSQVPTAMAAVGSGPDVVDVAAGVAGVAALAIGAAGKGLGRLAVAAVGAARKAASPGAEGGFDFTRLPPERRQHLLVTSGGLQVIKMRLGEKIIAASTVEEAKARFRFPAGHPKEGKAYLLHPLRSDTYLVPATGER